MRTHKPFLPGALCALALAVTAISACNDEPVPLFDEQGTWSLTKFDIDGKGLTTFDVGSREDKFLLHYDQDAKIVAAAACLDSMGRTDLTTTLCDTGKFACRCFNYEFTEKQMVWTEFPPKDGELPPPPPEDAAVPAPGEPVTFAVENYPESGQTYRYDTLPYGLFNSDGDPAASEFVFQSRGDAPFIATGCIEVCGIPVAPAEGT
jgi:hypothetical protein